MQNHLDVNMGYSPTDVDIRDRDVQVRVLAYGALQSHSAHQSISLLTAPRTRRRMQHFDSFNVYLKQNKKLAGS